MKQATGELSMTIVVVALVAILVAFFYAIVWPNIRNSMAKTQNCNNVICDYGTISYKRGKGTIQCQYYNAKGEATGKAVTCPWKG